MEPGRDMPLMQVLKLLPDLADEVGEASRAAADHDLHVRVVEIDPGDDVALSMAVEGAPCLLVASGFAAQITEVARRTSAVIFGPGEIFEEDPFGASIIEVSQHWRALTRVRLVVLDRDTLAQLAVAPEVGAALLKRTASAISRQALVRAILVLPTIDARLLAYLWHLALRWGTTSKTGIVVPIPLSHELLAQLLLARRPTITAAAGRLRREGLVEPTRSGWRVMPGVTREASGLVPAPLRWEPLADRLASTGVSTDAVASSRQQLASERMRLSDTRRAHAQEIALLRERTASMRKLLADTRARKAKRDEPPADVS